MSSCIHYTRGVDAVSAMRKTWAGLAPYVDARALRAGRLRFSPSRRRRRSGGATRASRISRRFSKRPLPAGVAPPEHSLEEYEAIQIPYAPGSPPANPGKAPEAVPPAELTSEEDHQRLLRVLGIAALRPGANPRDPKAANAPNYDESKANPYPKLPDPLKLANGRAVKSADVWWKQRRAQIVEDFDREVYGRVPANLPVVKWEVKSQTRETIAGVAAITRHVIGHVDNSSYPLVTVDIDLR